MTEVKKTSDSANNKRKRELRDKQVLEDYAKPDATARSVAEKHGLSEISVRKIVAGSGIQKPKGRAKKVVADPDAEKSLSPLHKKLGVRLTGFLRLTGNWTYSDAAEHLGWPTQKVSGIGKGTYELTLTDIAKLAEFMDISINKLMDRLDESYDLSKTPIPLDVVPEAPARDAPGATSGDDLSEEPVAGDDRSDPPESSPEDTCKLTSSESPDTESTPTTPESCTSSSTTDEDTTSWGTANLLPSRS